MEHKDRHAIVTGGGTGIGLGIALALAGAGAQVTITGRDERRLASVAAMHPRLHALGMDVSSEASVRDGVDQAADARGPVSICIANAGIAEPASFRSETLAHWRETMTTNLDGVFLTFQAALSTLGREEWGRMIAISSIAGLRGLKGASAYTASKHGVIGLVRALSEEHLGAEITFNAICPGYVDTPIVDRNAEQIAKSQKMSAEDARDLLARGNRHKRLLGTDEVTATALWLCSSAARSVNGQSIQIAGGQVS
ncbi:SDR family NAD(P)-dependent oxidoreductase [Jannaschia sp. CCS1]|uniref:SDR family NAD(P)-dependent oxidoreductase n=1 Tax=Jannaschia sp. (strain CCS1) TaxID=290400 RepID=UPI000053A4FF|nr:SDR family oxidoreductase [Jannaschia sp. CCS1]ABD56200.1 short-chain dehydrogenase/reductase SDR [Jannaschia sp. CCS1]